MNFEAAQKNNKEIEDLCALALDAALKAGASGADIIYSEGQSAGISLKDGEIEESVTGYSSGLGIRTIMSDGRQGIASGNRINKASVLEMVEWSIHNCRNSQPDEGVMLYSGKLVEDPAVIS